MSGDVPNSGGRINLDLLRLRAQEIRRAANVLAGYSNLSREEFISDQLVVDAAKYRLLVAIEAAASMCTHLAARQLGEAPSSYAQCFQVLASSGIISPELAERLAAMARFRNLLVHVYAEVDDSQVWEVLQSDLGDLEDYLSAIGTAVKDQLK